MANDLPEHRFRQLWSKSFSGVQPLDPHAVTRDQQPNSVALSQTGEVALTVGSQEAVDFGGGAVGRTSSP